MAEVIIPVFSDTPNYSVQTEFDGVPYSLRFSWNAREGYWYADLLDEQEEETLVAGQKVIPFVPTDDYEENMEDLATSPLLDSLCLFPGYLPGVFFAWSATQPTGVMEDLTAMQLVYVEYADLVELAEGDE